MWVRHKEDVCNGTDKISIDNKDVFAIENANFSFGDFLLSKTLEKDFEIC